MFHKAVNGALGAKIRRKIRFNAIVRIEFVTTNVNNVSSS